MNTVNNTDSKVEVSSDTWLLKTSTGSSINIDDERYQVVGKFYHAIPDSSTHSLEVKLLNPQKDLSLTTTHPINSETLTLNVNAGDLVYRNVSTPGQGPGYYLVAGKSMAITKESHTIQVNYDPFVTFP